MLSGLNGGHAKLLSLLEGKMISHAQKAATKKQFGV